MPKRLSFRTPVLLLAALAAAATSTIAGTTSAQVRAVLRQAQGDLEGRGQSEPMILYTDGTIAIGARTGRIELGDVDEAFMREYAELAVVEIDRARGVRGLLVRLPSQGDEDPPDRFELLIPRGTSLRNALAVTFRVASDNTLRFAGDARARHLEDDAQACARTHRTSGHVARREITFRLRADGTMRAVGRRATTHMASCTILAACPFVDVVDDSGVVTRVGEILRDLRGADAYARQTLELPRATGRVMRVQLAEEKPEVTFVDELYLEVDGARIAPRSCAAASPPAYCSPDRRMYLLHPGDRLEVEFDVPASATNPHLVARGYYVPMR